MLQEKISEPPRHVIPHPAAAAPPQADDPRVDLKELIRVMRRRRKIILWIAAVPVLLALALRPRRDAALHDLDADPDRPARPPHRQQRGRRRRLSPPDGGVAVVESQLLVITSDTVLRRAIVREHLDTDPEFGGPAPASRACCAMRSRPSASASDGGDAGAQGAAPAQEAHRREALRQGIRRRSLRDQRGPGEIRAHRGRVAQAYLDDQTEVARERGTAAPRRRSADGSTRCARACRRRRTASCSTRSSTSSSPPANVLVSDQQLSEMTLQLNTARGKTAEARARYDQIDPRAPVRRRERRDSRRPCCRRPSGSCARSTPRSRASAPSSARWSARAIRRSPISMRRSRACRS